MANIKDLNLNIHQAFDTLLTLLANQQLDTTKIENQFAQIFEKITDLEDISYSHYVNHRFRYHKIHLAYFQKIKDNKKEIKEEESSIQTDHISNQERNYDSEESWKSIQDRITSLTHLQDTNEIPNILKDIHNLLIPIFQHPITTINEYIILQNNSNEILSLFETLKMTELDEIPSDENNDQNSNYIDLLNDLIDFVFKDLENRQIYFVEVLLSDLPYLNKVLFDDIPQTEQSITRCYREWARIFYSDKHDGNPKFDELMKHINYIRDCYLSKIYSLCTKSNIIKNELDQGHKHAKLSMDFKKRFNDGGDKELNVEQLEKLVSYEALRAFEHYRAALKSLGKMNQNEADIIQRARNS
ncbi:unnamed protein product [Rotaria sordida]|uniref:Uncharacterized protein n=1 Tax=Rotaria sordida TaxID=392033 RepID=A0A819GRQ5_9BILA|nr:unnamed protein product [Rotaria sordida]